MAEFNKGGEAPTLSDGSAAKSVEQAEGSGAIRKDQQSGARTAPDCEAAIPLYPLYRDRGHLEEELHRRTLALATLAHEIKNPLSIISGYVELLLNRKVGPLTERQGQILEATSLNCQRMQKFAQEFLAYGSLAMGDAAAGIRLESGDLGDCLSEVCGYWMDKFSAQGVALYFRAGPEVPHFMFDYHKVQQVVSNLLENSLKFTPLGGTVWLTSEPHMWERRGRLSQVRELERRRNGSAEATAVPWPSRSRGE